MFGRNWDFIYFHITSWLAVFGKCTPVMFVRAIGPFRLDIFVTGRLYTDPLRLPMGAFPLRVE
ncbi:RNA-directed RNA polymerase, partial [Dissostichus eleginoides]